MSQETGEWNSMQDTEIYLSGEQMFLLARPPIYAYGKYYPDDMKENEIFSRPTLWENRQ